MSYKKVLIQHTKKGKIEVGSLSHNEACRAIVELLNQTQSIVRQHQLLDLQYQNHVASWDAS